MSIHYFYIYLTTNCCLGILVINLIAVVVWLQLLIINLIAVSCPDWLRVVTDKQPYATINHVFNR